jgi:predicted enzyme involved in methoxymalonyl-ACP biosynthesis
MSCRVLNRKLENIILNRIVKYCKIKKIKKIIGIYIQTKKNSLVKKLYIDLGFLRINNQKNSFQFFYDINIYKNKQTFVENKIT